MSDEGQASATTAGKNSQGFWTERLASLWKTLGFAFIAVLVAAAAMFVFRRERLTSELPDHYARTAARHVREIELKFSNYHDVVDNITRVSGVTREASKAALRVEAAEARFEALKRAMPAMDAVDLFPPTTTLTQLLGPQPGGAPGSADLRLDAVDTLRLAAVAAVARRAAEESYRQAAGLATGASNVARHARQAEERAELASAPGARAEDVRANAVAVREARDRAQTERDVVERDMMRPGKSAAPTALRAADGPHSGTSAEEDARFAQQASRTAQVLAEEVKGWALVAADQAASDRERARRSLGEAEAKKRAFEQLLAAAAAPGSATKAPPAETSSDQRDLVDADFSIATERSDQLAARLARLTANLLPSYRATTEGCVAKYRATPAAVELCIAKEIARTAAAAANQDLEIVACPADLPVGDRPRVSPDGESLIFARPDAGALAACGKLPTLALLKSIHPQELAPARASNRSFDEVLLLRADGSVLYAPDRDSQLRLSALPKFEPKFGRASSVLSEVEIGSRKYRAFLQPIAAGIAGGCAPGTKCEPAAANAKELVFCGLVDESRLSSEALEVSPGFFLWAMVLLCFGVLAVPLAKLWLAGPHTRFRGFDVALLSMSGLVTTMLTVVLIFATTTYHGLRQRLDGQLEAVATQVSARARGSVDALAQALDGYTRRSAPLLEHVTSGALLGEDLLAFGGACRGTRGPNMAGDVLTDPARQWPTCEEVNVTFEAAAGNKLDSSDRPVAFIANGEGYQWVKTVADSHAPNPISVGERSYFKRALAGQGVCLRKEGCDAGAGRPAVALEVVRSLTLGEIMLVAAQPVIGKKLAKDKHPLEEKHPVEDKREPAVAALSARLPAFDHAVLPLGLEFAIVDGSGRVMLHSDNDAHHGQNLFDDLDKQDEFGAALASGVADSLSVRYRGIPSRVHLQPLPGLDWRVVVFGPCSLVEMMTVDIVVLALFGFVLLLVPGMLTLGTLVLIGRWVRKRRTQGFFLSIRPNHAYAPEYAKAGLLMLILATLLAASAFYGLPTGWLLIVAVIAAALGIICVPGVGFFASKKVSDAAVSGAASRDETGLRRFRGYRVIDDGLSFILRPFNGEGLSVAYPLCCAGLAGVLMVGPTTVILAAAHRHTSETTVRAEQDHFARALRGNPCFEQVGVPTPSSKCSNVYAAGLERARFEPRPLARLEPTWLSAPERCAADLLPALESQDRRSTGRLYKATSVWSESESAALPPSESRTWVSQASSVGLVTLPFTGSILRSKIDGLYELDHFAFFIALLVFGVAGVLGFLLTSSTTKRLLFLKVLEDLDQRAPLDEARLSAILGSTPRHVLALYPEPDLARAFAAPDFLIVEKLDQRLAEPGLLELVKEAVAKKSRRIVAFCDREPLPQARTDTLRAAWADVLQDFHPVVGTRSGPRPAVEKSPLEELTAESQPANSRKQEPKLSQAKLAHLFASCDEDERRVLAQLTFDGYANPHRTNHRALASLAGRGILARETLTVFDDDFQRYVEANVSPAELAKWETDAGQTSSAYRTLRIPLLTAVVLIFAVVTAVHPALAAMAPLVPVLAASLPQVLKVLASVMGSSKGAT